MTASPGRGRERAFRAKPRRRLHQGFTLIELLILIIVIAIIALIVIPQILAAARRSSETALRGDLRNFRVAIERFYADCGGYPPRLDDVMAWSGDHVSAVTDGTGSELDLKAYQGPYLRTGDMLLPFDPFTDLRDWQYNSATGEVHSNCDVTGTNGTPYSSW